MRFLLDSNIISAVARDPRGAAGRRLRLTSPGEPVTSVVVVGELLFGLAKSRSLARERQLLAILEAIDILPIEEGAARHYGTLRATLEQEGRPIGANDYWIAAQALAADCILVTDNEREFRRVPGLRVESWLR